MGLFNRNKKQNEKAAAPQSGTGGLPAEVLNDVTYIRDMKHTRGTWQQYDVLLAAQGYGWQMMVDWAAYMEKADLDGVSTLTVAEMANMPETELIDAYRKAGGGLKAFAGLAVEKGQLAVGGISRVLKAPTKIVWFNQTRVLRVFTLVDDEELLTRYIETMIRRTFGTKDAMKRAKPIPDKK